MKLIVLVGFLLTQTSFADESWRGKMQQLSQGLSDILPDLFSKSTENSDAFKDRLKRIHEITSALDQSGGHATNAPDDDPSLSFVSQIMNETIERAYQSAQEGNAAYAKLALKSSVSYCIACHTRTQDGPQFPLLKAFSEPLKTAAWIDRVSFLAASRQVESAFDEVLAKLKSKQNDGIPGMDLELGSRLALTLAVRVMDNPKKAMALAEAVVASPNSTASHKEAARIWLRDLKSWQREKKTNYKSDQELIAAARKLTGSSSSWRLNAEIPFLRASALMHDLLKHYPHSEFTGEALFLIGLAYENLRDLGFWSLHEMYFETCIKKSPHTAIA